LGTNFKSMGSKYPSQKGRISRQLVADGNPG